MVKRILTTAALVTLLMAVYLAVANAISDDVSILINQCPAASLLVIIDEDSIDNGSPPNFFTDVEVNDDIA